jgi:non-ribosomal peptide synthetase component F
VAVEHRQVLALLDSARELLGFGPHDRYLAASTIAFDASVTELFLPLISGASLLPRDRSILIDPRRLAREVREHAVTVVATGPSVWAVVLAEVPDFPRLRVLITHGEAVAPELARRLCAHGEQVWNLYGPTETTVWARPVPCPPRWTAAARPRRHPSAGPWPMFARWSSMPIAGRWPTASKASCVWPDPAWPAATEARTR